MNRPIRCRVCQSSRLRERPFGYRFNGRWLQAWECIDCEIIFIDPQPSSGELRELYSKEYFDGDYRCGHEGRYFDPATLDRLAESEVLRIIRSYKPGGNFLEVGCAGGAFLDAARRHGYTTYGVEVSEHAAGFARQEFGLNVTTGDVRIAKFRNNMFDVVYLGDVLEHLPDPRDTLEELRRITTADGILVLECPMQTNTLFSRLGFFLWSLLRRKATVQLPPYHLFEYRPSSLEGLLRRTGFKVVKKTQDAIWPGEISMRGTMLQRIGKKAFQYPNYIITRVAGLFGDRIRIIARNGGTASL